MAVGGGSADRKAEELAASGDATASAWAAGAEGERRVAHALSALPEAWTVLHDRFLSPGLSSVNLDHVVVGPTGAYFIDAKNWKGAISAWEGNLYQHIGPRDARQSVSKHREIDKVHGMAKYMRAETGVPVIPVICLAGRYEAKFDEPQVIRGVWVVAASQVTAWLRAQPVTLEREQVERAAVTLMTSFPSTTTDEHLLAAMGAASQAAHPRRRGARRARAATAAGRPAPAARLTPVPRPPRRRRVLGRALQLLLALAFLGSAFALMKALPGFLVDGVVAATSSSTAPAPTPGVADTPSVPPRTVSTPSPPRQTSSTSAKASAQPAAQPVSRCSGLSAEQVGKIVGRTVHPVATRTGCSWGSRLDDPSTVKLTLQTQDEHRPTDFQFVASASQRRVVYGAAYDSNYRPATALWVATGQPIVGKQTTVTARTNTHVVVSTNDLKITDERARWMARAIAMAVNATP